MTEPLLEIDDLHVHFETEEGTVEALDGVSITVGRDEVVGVIGESGCGKSVTALSTMGLLQSPPAKIERGSIRYDGQDLLELSKSELNEIRGDDITMIYQDPMSSLNPVLTIGKQIIEPLLAHRDISKSEARTEAKRMLEAVGLADAERLLAEYPEALSGGMRQRVVIAMALITEPDLLIADEPTTALDVTIQAQIVDLLRDLREEFGMSVLFISHDLPVISEIADRMAVMYAGNVVETCAMRELFEAPLHPYTRKLAESIPKVGEVADRLPTIEGTVPELIDPPQGCRFASRCPQYIGDVCDSHDPELAAPDTAATTNHRVACHLYDESVPSSPPWHSRDEHEDSIRNNGGEEA
ncbi:ABC transporter ATP-binding protein [Halogeometricum borinquense]|uniref:ABC-type dipeptide/oligopeptide/nickel transport system, ATPase component n=4 Tax=Halogeometricum borinquense TaxID=60847 RepID=E4NU28_HALBP|nr:ABC transporter ATP-binding protein [Halogeometricum borinquense]ADQ68548.1 ABC-type dipeptide/oligopeptide/nickel transport system, ATPase component [Halogeometricum borinquense DSM 11551]RYJ08541.1 ABC transporter ATP-binding protein [Halogeometricum borinquense]